MNNKKKKKKKKKRHSVSCMTILFSMLAKHQIKHQATCKVGCQPGNCRWPLNLPWEFL